MTEADSPPVSPPVAVPATAGRRVRLILILGALTAIAPLSIDMYLPALPRLTSDFHTTPVLAQLTLTACVIGLALGQVVAGPLSDRLGRRVPLLVGMAAYAVASLLCVVAPTIETFIGLRLVQGAAGAAGIVIARAIVSDMYEGPAAARFFSLLMLVNGLAPILAPVLGGQLLRFTPWPGVFVALTGVAVALLLGSLFWVGETLPPDERQKGGVSETLATFRTLLGDRTFVGYALAPALAFGAMFVYISGSPFVLQDLYHLSPQTFSLAFGVNALGIVVVGQISGRLVGRVPLRALLNTGLAIVAAGGVALLVAVLAGAGLAGVLPALFLVVAGQGLVLPNATALALTGRPPHTAGSASALLGLTTFALGGAVAPLAGVGGQDTALPMAVTIAVLSLLALAVSAATRPKVASPN